MRKSLHCQTEKVYNCAYYGSDPQRRKTIDYTPKNQSQADGAYTVLRDSSRNAE